jgi:uracil DNA glycosylase
LPLLKPVIERQPRAAQFIGPGRGKHVVPVRELTFQALKPNPPEGWKVVIFGQNPYPRVESATGIAMFDNTFNHWKDSQFGRVTSIRCIIKAAAMWKYKIARNTPIADIRALLAKEQTVQPPAWFQAMLTQGVLLLNASLTASDDGAHSTEEHTAFWRPVAEKVVDEILKARENDASLKNKGVVFGWWGTHARALRDVVDRLQNKYPHVPVVYVNHPNPAAQGDIFCDNDHFGTVNKALKSLGLNEVDWLPSVGWDKAHDQAAVGRIGDFMTTTMELHKFYLDRLQGVRDEKMEELAPIDGVLATALMDFAEAVRPLHKVLTGIENYSKSATQFARNALGKATAGALNEHEIAAVHLYTMGSPFYRQLNAALRDPNRALSQPYFPYLRLFFSALDKMERFSGSLWRGVALDLRKQYPKGSTVTWWGVSSCTSKLSVAQGFSGGSSMKMLFEVVPKTAVGIRALSAFTGEEEYVLAPGTQLEVVDVKTEGRGTCRVKLEELEGSRKVT